MSDPRVRRDIARLAARLMYERSEKEYFTAKRKAARQLRVKEGTYFQDLPSNAEIREQIEILAQMCEGESRAANLLAMRLAALRVMRKLSAFHPRLIGSVWTGHIRRGSDIDIHAFWDSEHAVVEALEWAGHECRVEHKRIVKHSQAREFTHIHLDAGGGGGVNADQRFAIEVTLYPEAKRTYVFKSSITGKAIEKATMAELEERIRREHPEIDIETELARIEEAASDPYSLWMLLLQPLEGVKQNPKYHPEGDALYHSLQVFQLAVRAKPWDEEFLVAALLHDVGKALYPLDHVNAGVDALGGTITERTRFLIAHHMDALHLHDGKLGQREARRLSLHPDFDDLMLLRELDSAGRRGGVVVPTIEEALATIRAVAEGAYWRGDS
jgi:predicted HD phosphohydrolase